MSRIFWDANLFIYMLEGSGPQSQRALALRQAMARRGDQLFTSALAVGEVLVGPMAAGDVDEGAQYRRWIESSATVLGFDTAHAEIFAKLRCGHGVRAPDAIHLACAAKAGMDLFITADTRLHRLQVPGIQFMVPLERAPI